MRRFQVPSLGFFVSVSVLLGLTGGLQLASLTSRTASALSTCTSTRSANDSNEQSVVSQINAYRQSNGLPALVPTVGLTRAAISKSTDMAATGNFAHDDIMSTMARFSACGNSSTSIGENIAAGNMDAASTFAQWKSSAEHNANMLGPNFRAVGVARAVSGVGYPYWTTEFSNSVDAALPGGSSPAGNPGQPSFPTNNSVSPALVPLGAGQGYFPGGGFVPAGQGQGYFPGGGFVPAGQGQGYFPGGGFVPVGQGQGYFPGAPAPTGNLP